MTILKHEMRQSRNTLLIWTAAIGFLLAVCIFLFPEMESEMEKSVMPFPQWEASARLSAWIRSALALFWAFFP